MFSCELRRKGQVQALTGREIFKRVLTQSHSYIRGVCGSKTICSRNVFVPAHIKWWATKLFVVKKEKGHTRDSEFHRTALLCMSTPIHCPHSREPGIYAWRLRLVIIFSKKPLLSLGWRTTLCLCPLGPACLTSLGEKTRRSSDRVLPP